MNSVRPSSSSLRCVSHSTSSFSRAFSTPGAASTSAAASLNLQQHPPPPCPRKYSGYSGRLERRSKPIKVMGPRPLYDPHRYRDSLASTPREYPAALPASSDPVFKDWISKEGPAGGAKYRETAKEGPNWMGGDVPFPANPSFKPPPPMSDAIKTMLYALHLSDTEKWTIRKLSERFGISLARVGAILRLKELEESWRKDDNKVLQTGFLAGMELHLNARQPSSSLRAFIPPGTDREQSYDQASQFTAVEDELNSRDNSHNNKRRTQRRTENEDTAENEKREQTAGVTDADMADNADQIAREEGIIGGAGVGAMVGRGNVPDRMKGGLQRTFWEDVKEGNTPVSASLYDAAKKASLARKAVQRARGEDYSYIIVKPQRSGEDPVFRKSSKELAAWKFVDVGDKFVDKRDAERREKEKERRWKKH